MTAPDRVQDPILIDCTLREGPYECWFAPADITRIARTVSAAGVRYLEVGAETGLGSRSDVDDAAQVRAVMEAAPRAHVGVIAGATTATSSQLRRVLAAGARFIRVAAGVTTWRTALPMIEMLRDEDVWVTFNAIKCYALDAQRLLQIARHVTTAGAEIFYLVDSAGALLPSEVQQLTATLRDGGIRVGFHGHDNLALAVANSLAAVEAGAAAIDGTLRGIGRSAGNAQIEVLVKAVQRHGVLRDIDGDALCRASEQLIASRRLRDRGVAYVDIAMGEGRFHSERLELAREIAQHFDIPVECLVRAVGVRDPIAPNRAFIEAIAAALAGRTPPGKQEL